MNRRNFIKNAAGILIAAPMVVKAENIMKVVVPKMPSEFDVIAKRCVNYWSLQATNITDTYHLIANTDDGIEHHGIIHAPRGSNTYTVKMKIGDNQATFTEDQSTFMYAKRNVILGTPHGTFKV